MKIFITGGTGFIGANLALNYASEGHDVVVISKEATDAERENSSDLKAAGVAVLQGNITDHTLLRDAVQGVDLVFHIAAAMREANIPNSEFWNVNVETTRKLLDYSREAGVSRFVYCSSIGVFGKKPRKPTTEDTPCDPKDIYQVTKKAAEELCLNYQAEHQFPLSVVRPAEVYGPRDRRLVKLFRAIKAGKFAMIGSGKNHHHLVFIDDMLQGFRLAAERDEAIGGVFVIAGAESVPLTAMVDEISSQLDAGPPKLKIPLFPVYLAGALTEFACKPFRIQPPIYRRRVDFFRSDFSFDISRAREVLGYEPRFDLRSGIRETLLWCQERGLV